MDFEEYSEWEDNKEKLRNSVKPVADRSKDLPNVDQSNFMPPEIVGEERKDEANGIARLIPGVLIFVTAILLW